MAFIWVISVFWALMIPGARSAFSSPCWASLAAVAAISTASS